MNMAAVGLVSPPARMAHQDAVVIISSSPEFPSICDLLPKTTKKPPLRSGSNAAPVPDDAPSAFTSAASIWRSSRLHQTEGNGTLEVTPLRSATSTKPSAILAIESSPNSATKITNRELGGESGNLRARAKSARTTRKQKIEQSESRDATDEPLVEVPTGEVRTKKDTKKPRTTKDGAMAQTTLPRGKVTKLTAKELQSGKKAEIVSKHFITKISAPVPTPELAADPREDGPVMLEPAMRRRMDWTPPRESVSTHHLADTPTTKELVPSSGPARKDVFRTLRDTYGRNLDSDRHVNAAPALTNLDILGKRKLIEMVAPAGSKQKTPEDSPAEPKLVKKKPRTITELATAAYRLPEMDDTLTDEAKQDSLLGYLETTDAQAGPTCETRGAKAKRSKNTAKSKAKLGKKKEQVPKRLLLSPMSAMRQVAKQDFVFGTASQLATEEDPELLRALHEAMKASNQPDNDPFISLSPMNGNLSIRRRHGSGLWAAGARFNGDLIDMEVLDLTGSSPLPLARLLPKAPCVDKASVDYEASNKQTRSEIEMSNDTFDLSTSPRISYPGPPLPPTPGSFLQVIQLEDSSPMVPDQPQTPTHELDYEPPPSNQEQHQLLLSQSNSPRQEKLVLPPRPDFELYTDARLTKEVASYGFKAVKKRTGMVALLNQCWESQNKAVLGSRVTRVTMSTSSANQTSSPSRPRGRPRKNSLASVADSVDAAPARLGGKKSGPVGFVPSESAQVEKRSRGRPRKNSVTSTSDIAEASGPVRRGRKKSIPTNGVETEPPQNEKRPRGRPKKGAIPTPTVKPPKVKAAIAPKCAKSPARPTPTAPPRRAAKTSPKKTAIEIPDSDSESDPFASTPPSSPSHGEEADLFSSPPSAMDLSVTEDTEDSSLMASPTTQQVALFGYITKAVVGAPRTTDPANPSWHEKMLMYDPVILEDLTAWLNAGQLDRVGYEGEVAPGDVKKWCESKSVCCLWRVNLRGRERKRL